MELPRIYEHLEALLARLDVPVRTEPFDARLFGDLGVRGGICAVRGRRVVLVDARAPLADRVGVLAGVLASFDLSDMYVPPQVREIIEAHAIDPLPGPIGIKKAHLRLVGDPDPEEPERR